MSNKKKSGLTRRANGLMALEPRYMFDGAAISSVADSFGDHDSSILHRVADSAKSSSALTEAQKLTSQTLTDYLQKPDVIQQLLTLFNGGKSQATAEWQESAKNIVSNLLNQNVDLRVELRSSTELKGALGAFAQVGTDGLPVIYLNSDFVKTATPEAIQTVLLEEIGHAIDALLNPTNDSPGDEGRAFASLLLNGDANLSENLLRNDHFMLTLDGQQISVEESANLGIAQINYVPMPEADIQTALKSIAGATKVSGNIQTVVAITATDNNTVVAYDHWEDNYETNLSDPTQASTKVWVYSGGQWYNDIDKSGTYNTGDTAVVAGSGITVNGQTLILTNAVNPLTPLTVDFDGRDKIGSSKAISVTRAGWSTTPGTVLAGAVSVIDAGNAGKSYILPMGQNVVTAATDIATSRLFEYTSVNIMAISDNTTVSIDRDGNGTVDTTVVLNEGQTYMVNGGVFAGAKITADKGITVNAIAGDVGSAFDNRWFTITPYEQWSNSYYAPVGTTLAADPATVFLYNPDASNAITVYYDNSTSTRNSITIAANTAKYVQMTGSAAHFYTLPNGGAAAAKFYAISTIDSDATSHSTHDWSYSLVPESYLTTKFVAGWAPGVDNVTRSIAATDANGSPVWVTTTANTYLYIDSTTVTVKNSAGTVIAADSTYSSNTSKRYAVKTLESYRLTDSDKDQSGLTVYTLDGTLITGAWGEDPSVAGAGTPYLDMGYTLQPLPEYVFTKVSGEAPNGGNPQISNGNGIIELGEQIQYTLNIVNRSVIDMFAPTITDSWSPLGAVSYVTGSAKLTVYDTDGTTVLSQFTIPDGTNGAFPLSGGYTLLDVDNNSSNGITGLGRGQKIVVTYQLKLPSVNDSTQLSVLAGNYYQINNSAQFSDQAGTTKQTVNVVTSTTTVTDGEVFLYDAAFSSTQTSFKPNDTIGVQVTDLDQSGRGPLTVSVSSLSGTTVQDTKSVTLTEVGTTGVFKGTLNTATTTTAGKLTAVSGNTIRVNYTDPTTGSVFDNPTLFGTVGTFLTGNANSKSASVFAVMPASTDGLIQFFYDSNYTQSTGNFSEGNTVYIQLTDADQNFDASTVGTVTVKVTNTTTGEIESVTLNETGINTGIFRGALSTTTDTSVNTNNNGNLSAVLGDSLKVEYTDPISGANFDSPTKPGITGNYLTGNANTDLAAFTKTKVLYLSADAADGDISGDLDRIDPSYDTPVDTVLESTAILTSNLISSNTATISVQGLTSGSDQSIAKTTNRYAQSFKLAGTTIGKVQLYLSDTNGTTNSGRVNVFLRSSLDGPNLASASIAGSTLTSSKTWATFDFANVSGLTNNGTYFLVLDNQSSDNNAGTIKWYAGNGNNYSDGTPYDGSGSALTRDFSFRVYATDTSTSYAASYSSSSKNVDVGGASTLYAQSFKVDGSGTYGLDKLTLNVKDTDATANAGYVYAYLRSSLTGDNLATASIKASDSLTSSYQSVLFDFATNPSLNKGTTYYVVLDNQSSGNISWQYTSTSTYSNGSYWANSSSASASYSATTARDFVLSAIDTSGSTIIEVPFATGKATIASNAYAGESFSVSGTGTYVLDKIKVQLADPDNSSNTGNLTLSVLSGGINGTVLSTATYSAASLSKNGVLSAVTFDLPNTTLTKGTTYFIKLTNGSNNSIEWAKSNYDTYAAGSSYANSTTASTTSDYQFDLYEATSSQVTASFSQSISMAEDFKLPAGGALKVVTYVSNLSGGTPTTGNIAANLSYGSGTAIANLTDFTFTSTGASTGYITWNATVASNITVAAGQAIHLNVTNNQSGLAFAIDYDSTNARSRIELSTPTVIQVQDISFYDNTFENGGQLISGGAVFAGDTAYVRVKVSDPFGAYDITQLGLSIDGPGNIGDVSLQTLTNTNVIDDPSGDNRYKIYEYAWRTVNNTGNYTVNVTASEGYEGTITSSGTGSIAVAALDRGTPSKTQFITALTGVDAGPEYQIGDNSFLRVTDLDKNTNAAAAETVTVSVNGTTFTLTETGNNTGVFERALNGASFTNLAAGAVLSARYVDSTDSTDISVDSIAVLAVGNAAPDATDNDRTINENVNATGTNLITSDEGNDVDSDPDAGQTITIISINGNNSAVGTTDFALPSGALLTVASNGSYTYKPNGVFNYLSAGQNATDSFEYTISDGNGGTSTATVTVNVNGVDDPSINVPDSNGFSVLGQETVVENATLTGKTFTVGAPAGLQSITVAGTTITSASLNSATALSPVSVNTTLGVMRITGYSAGVVTYNYLPTVTRQDHSNGLQSVIDRISVTATDTAGTSSASNSIGILITDTAPTANADTNSITEDSGTTTATGNVITGASPGTDTASADGSTAVVGVAVGNSTSTLVNVNTINADINGTYGKIRIQSDGSYVYTINNALAATNSLAAGSQGTDVFTYTIKDADGSLSKTTVTMTVNGANDLPLAKGNSYNAVLDQLLADKNIITNTDTTNGTDSDVETAIGNLVISSVTPAGGTLTALASLTNGTGNFSGWKVLTLAHGTAYLKADGSFKYQNTAGDSTGDSFSYLISDGTGNSTDAVVTLSISASNTAPVARNNSYSTTEDTLLTGSNVITDATADSDADNDQLTLATVNGTAFVANSTDAAHLAANGWMQVTLTNGTLFIKENGTTEYKPSLDSSTGDTFTYTLSDGINTSNTATVSISVTAVNDAPVLDLDANNSSTATGANYLTSYRENATSISVADTDISVLDVDNSNLSSATLVLTNAKSGDSLTIGNLPTGITGQTNNSVSGQITITLSGSATKADYLLAIQAVKFSSSSSDYADRVLTVRVNDGQVNSNLAQTTISMSADNRDLSVNNISVNEASPYAVFTVSGASGQNVKLELQTTGTGAGFAVLNTDTTDPVTSGKPLQYFNGTQWVDYTASSFVRLSSSTLLVRTSIQNDSTYEGNETFKLVATNAAGVVNVSTAGNQGVATIYDDGTGNLYPNNTTGNTTTGQLDDDRPAFSINDVTVNEAAGTMTFTVTKTGSTALASSVQFATLDDTALAATDYTATSGTLNFAASDTSKTFTVSITNDALFERSEAFKVNLSSASSAVLSDSQGLGTIRDDGTGNSSSGGSGSGSSDNRALSVNSITVNEGSPFAVFSVSANAGETLTLTLANAAAINNASSSSATDGSVDFGPTLEYSSNGGSTWTTYSGAFTVPGSGTTASTLLVRTSVINDTSFEGAHDFTLSAAYTSGSSRSSSGAATIYDDGTGQWFDGSSATGSNTAPTGSTLNDDRPAFSINDVTVNEAAGTMTFTVTKTGSTALASSVQFATLDDTALAATDYTATSGTLNFAASDTSKTFTVSITNDALFERSEAFKVNLSSASSAVLSDSQGLGTIRDDGTGNSSSGGSGSGSSDNRALSVNSITVNEGSPFAVFSVSANAGETLTLTLANAAAINNASSSSATDGSVDFGPTLEYSSNGGSTWTTYSGAFTVPGSGTTASTLLVRTSVINDTSFEGAHDFTLSAAYTSGSSRSSSGAATIYDDGTGQWFDGSSATGSNTAPTGSTLNDDRPAFSINDVTVNEAAGTMTFTVTKTGSTALASSVQFATLDDTALAATDYTATSGTLNFAASDTSKTFTVSITNDALFERSEAFKVNLSSASSAVLSDSQGLGTIRDDGTGNSSSGGSGSGSSDNRALSVNSITVNEGSPFAVFSVSANAGETLTLTLANAAAINNASSSSATDGSVDFGPTLEYSSNGGSTWTTYSGAFTVPGSGTTASTLLVRTSVINDTSFEGAHDFTLSAAYTSGSSRSSSGAATIYDDGTGQWFDGSSATGSNTAPTGSTLNDDRPAFSINDVTVNEAAGTMTFTVTKTGSTALASSVQFATLDDTALAATDYTATSGTLNFAASDTSKTFTVSITNDALFERSEAFKVNLSSASSAVLSDSQGLGTIRDDGTGNSSSGGSGSGSSDNRALSVNSITVNEGSPFAVFSVSANAGETLTLTLANAAAINNASSSSATDGSVDFGPTLEYSSNGGSTWTTYSGAFTVPGSGTTASTLLVRTSVINDTSFEGAHDFTLSAAYTSGSSRSSSGAATIYDDGTGQWFDGSSATGSNTAPTGSTLNDDRPAFSINDVTVNEAAGTMTFTVTKTGSTALASSVQFATLDDTALAATDYTATSGTLNFAASDTSKTFTVSITNDALFERSEAFKVNLSSASSAVLSDSQGLGTIRDDGTGNSSSGGSGSGSSDNRALSVNSITVNEGSPFAVFSVSANAGETLTLTLANAAAINNASSSSATDGSVDFGPTLEYSSNGGSTWTTYSGAFTVPGSGTTASTLLVRTSVINDTSFEGAHDFTLSAAYTSGSSRSSSGVATIYDDGTGQWFDGSSATGSNTAPTGSTLNDDRPILVLGGSYNEASPRALFTVYANRGQYLTLDVQNAAQVGGKPTGGNEGKANDSLDNAPMFVSLDGGATWQLYAGRIVAGTAPVLVAVDISNEHDDFLEGEEQLKLLVTSGSQSVSAYASIFDNGQGTLLQNIDVTTRNNNGLINVTAIPDDDRPKPILVMTPVVTAEPAKAAETPVTTPATNAVPSFNSVLQPTVLSKGAAVEPALNIVDVKTSASGYQIPVNDSAPPGLTVYRGVTDQFVQSTDVAVKVSLPFDAFIHSNKDAVIKLQAKQSDDSPLPNWVQFDPVSGVFEVVAPKGFKGKLDVKVVARDDDGREVTAMFQLFVGEQTSSPLDGRPQGRNSFSEKLRFANHRSAYLVRVSDAGPHKQVANEPRSVKARMG